MSRLPAKPRNELEPEQQEIHDRFGTVAGAVFGPNGSQFIYEDSNGAFIGPVPFFAYQPEAGKACFASLTALGKLPVPPDARETALLAVGAHFQAGYETYSHIPQAVTAGLTKQQAVELKDGGKPVDLNASCAIAYDVAKTLCSKPGPLSQQLWDKAMEVFGKNATIGLVHYIGFYCYICVGLNAIDAPVPE